MANPTQLLQCRHCQSPVPAGLPFGEFCCAGCDAVYRILNDQGYQRYYELAGNQTAPVGTVPPSRAHAWLDPLVTRAVEQGGEVAALELDVQGIHCAACVWLMNEVFRREKLGASITVNQALGKVQLAWRQGFDVQQYVARVEAFGYQFGPSRKTAAKGSVELPVRLGISAALTMNVMLFSVSFYAGLAPSDGELFPLFTRLSLVLSTGVVGVGGWPFFRSAWQGLRTRVLHLDLPIALGILLVYALSLVQAQRGRGDLAYLDTLNTFITLMLVGRWLQARVLERNRRFLLEDDGADGIVVRRQEAGGLKAIKAPQVTSGDVLLVAPGDLVPVEAELLENQGRISTDWITGESHVRELSRAGILPAGSFNAGTVALRVKCRTDFKDSPLVALLRQMPPRNNRGAGHALFWNRLSTGWVVAVLALAAAGLLLWLPSGHERAVEVAVALLVVTCPCAIGIALPLSYELTQAALRREGFFVRSSDLLDRLVKVKTVVFDKTGTLTLGRIELANARGLESLDEQTRAVAYNLTARSSHPVSACLSAALARTGARFDESLEVVELPGRGLEAHLDGHSFRVGQASWACPGHSGDEATVLSRDGQRLFTFELQDALRRDAATELEGLRKSGYDVWLLSGDSSERVQGLAAQLGVSSQQALFERSPQAKAEEVKRIGGATTLYLGDGVNDSLAFEQALCAGTPAIDRPVMPGKSDFFLLGEGLSSLREGLARAHRLRQTVHRILALSLFYNLLAVSTSLLGLMTPLRAAVAMPVSSLSIILFAVSQLRARAPAPAPTEPVLAEVSA